MFQSLRDLASAYQARGIKMGYNYNLSSINVTSKVSSLQRELSSEYLNRLLEVIYRALGKLSVSVTPFMGLEPVDERLRGIIIRYYQMLQNALGRPQHQLPAGEQANIEERLKVLQDLRVRLSKEPALEPDNPQELRDDTSPLLKTVKANPSLLNNLLKNKPELLVGVLAKDPELFSELIKKKPHLFKKLLENPKALQQIWKVISESNPELFKKLTKDPELLKRISSDPKAFAEFILKDKEALAKFSELLSSDRKLLAKMLSDDRFKSALTEILRKEPSLLGELIQTVASHPKLMTRFVHALASSPALFREALRFWGAQIVRAMMEVGEDASKLIRNHPWLMAELVDSEPELVSELIMREPSTFQYMVKAYPHRARELSGF